MKVLILTSVLALSLVFLAVGQDARYVTVTEPIESGNPVNWPTNSIQIMDYETGEYISAVGNSTYISVIKNGLLFSGVSASAASGGVGTTVRGPALFVLSANSGGPSAMTVKITPVSFPPNQTLIVPPGTNQVLISLESSTNLVNWQAATNGVYGSPTSANFFRIHLTNLQP